MSWPPVPPGGENGRVIVTRDVEPLTPLTPEQSRARWAKLAELNAEIISWRLAGTSPGRQRVVVTAGLATATSGSPPAVTAHAGLATAAGAAPAPVAVARHCPDKSARWRARHPEAARERNRRWRAAHPEAVREDSRRRWEANRAEYNAARRRKRAELRASAATGTGRAAGAAAAQSPAVAIGVDAELA